MEKEKLINLIQRTFVLTDEMKQVYLFHVENYNEELIKKVYNIIINSEKKWIKLYNIDKQNKYHNNYKLIVEKIKKEEEKEKLDDIIF